MKLFVILVYGLVFISSSASIASAQKADGYFDLYDGDAYLEEIDNYLNLIRTSLEAMLHVRQSQNFSNAETSWSFSQAECQTELGEFSLELGRRAVGFSRNLPAGAFACRTGTYGTPGTSSFRAFSNVTIRNIDQSVVDVLAIRLDSSVNRGTVTKFLTTDAQVPMILLLKELGAPSVERYQNEIQDLYLKIGNLDEAKDQQCVVVGLIGPSGDAMVEYNFVGANSEDFCLSVFPNRYAETGQLTVAGEQEHNMILLAAARLSQGLSLWGMDGYARNVFARQYEQVTDNSAREDSTAQTFLSRLFNGFGMFVPDPVGPSEEEIVTALYEVPEYRALFRITLQDTNTFCEDSRNCTVEARYSFDLVPRTQDAFVNAYVSALYASGVSELETRMLRLSVQTALMFSEYPANVMAMIPGIGVDHTDLMTFVLGDEGWIYIPAEPTNSSSSSQSYDNPLQGFVREHSNF